MMKMKSVIFIAVLLLCSMAGVSAALVDPSSPGHTDSVDVSSTTVFQVTYYQVYYSSNGYWPHIRLASLAAPYNGYLYFYPDGTTLPTDYMVNYDIYIYYHLSDFENCIDMLRNENPVYLSFAGAENQNGLFGFIEPVGENENPAALVVTSPNSAVSWARSSVHSITWKSFGSPGAYVRIELLKGGALTRTITTSTENDGTYSWTVPSTQTVGTDYKIRITSTDLTVITDSSNSNFAIT